MSSTRRQWLSRVPAAAMAASSAAGQTGAAASRPNIVLVISDQFRWDCIGAVGANPMNLTPNLDAMASRGVLFRSAFCNQPVCAPARASIFTGQYPSRHGVWKNALGLDENATTLAGTLRQHGYSANYIGKWHLSPQTRPEQAGPVPPANRGGFLDLWEAANALEHTSHAYEGDLFDGDGKPIHFSGVYRADFMTQRAQRFLRSARSPFFLTLSYLEVHHQNDSDTFDPPKEYKSRYANAFIPHDLRPYPGSWPSQIADYFACVAKMDAVVGDIRKTLAETGLDRNTILMFVSDHANHFKTRNTEYKRSPHEGSIHVPLIVEGPGFNRGMHVSELVSQVDLMPTLLEAVGVAVPGTVEGHSLMPLVEKRAGPWRNEVYFQMAEFVTGRGLRTPQYTYAVMAPKQPGWKAVPGVERYVEYVLYDNYADPYQAVNLAGRAEYRTVAEELRQRLLERMREAGNPPATIEPSWFPYS
jgi:arylsulfatase A-like enzyme